MPSICAISAVRCSLQSSCSWAAELLVLLLVPAPEKRDDLAKRRSFAACFSIAIRCDSCTGDAYRCEIRSQTCRLLSSGVRFPRLLPAGIRLADYCILESNYPTSANSLFSCGPAVVPVGPHRPTVVHAPTEIDNLARMRKARWKENSALEAIGDQCRTRGGKSRN